MDNTVYALDSSTIDLCLSLFDWAPFRSTKAAVKLHTLLDLRGSIPTFIHVSDGKLADAKVLDMLSFEPGAFYVMDRGYVDFAWLYSLHPATCRRQRACPAAGGTATASMWIMAACSLQHCRGELAQPCRVLGSCDVGRCTSTWLLPWRSSMWIAASAAPIGSSDRPAGMA